MKKIDSNLKSKSPENDVYTYSFNMAEVKEINDALQRDTWINEVKALFREDNYAKLKKEIKELIKNSYLTSEIEAYYKVLELLDKGE